MKKLTSYLSLLAIVSVLSTGVNPASAALVGFSPTPALDPNGVAIGGIPAWYQDINGVAVKPCLVPATCGLIGLGDPLFNELLPLSFPGNFPSEAFYFDAVAIFPVGPANAKVVMALEYTFIDALTGALIVAPPRPATALGAPFQRQRVILTYPVGAPAPTAGNFILTNPWGVTTFPFSSAKCVNQNGATKCTMTRDLPLPGAIPPNFAAALGTAIPGSISTFLKDPTAPVGFLGSGAAALSFTGAVPGSANSVTVTDPLGNTGTTPTLTLLVGQIVGLEITPPVGGTFFGVVKPAGAVRKTFNINNLTGIIVPTLAIAANVPASNPVVASPDFTIAPSALLPCGATMAIGANCNFDVIFTPVGADGPRSATIAITGGVGVPTPAPPTVTGIADGTAPLLAFTSPTFVKTAAAQTLTGTASDANGIGAVTVSVDGGAAAAATVTGGTWTFTTPVLAAQDDALGTPVHNIVVNANDTALPAPGNTATSLTPTIVVDATPPVVTLTVQGQGTTTKNNTPVLTFTAADRNLAVTTVKVDGTIITPTPASGAAMAKLADGAHTVSVEATDSAGNISIKAAPAITIDTIVSPFTLTPVTAVTRVKTQTIGGTVEAGSTVNVAVGTGAAAPATVTGTIWSFPVANLVEGVNNITVTGTDTLGNTGTLPAINIKVVLPDGKITGAASVGIADALKALQFAIGLTQPTAEEALHADVAPLVNNVPAPNDKVDIGDVVVILKKVVDPASW